MLARCLVVKTEKAAPSNGLIPAQCHSADVCTFVGMMLMYVPLFGTECQATRCIQFAKVVALVGR